VTTTRGTPATASGATPPDDPDAAPRPTPWYRRRAALVGAGVLVVGVITVLTDLPQHDSRPVEIAGDTSVMNEVNADVGPCSYALGEFAPLLVRVVLRNCDGLRARRLHENTAPFSID